jgi:hypothetical protein
MRLNAAIALTGFIGTRSQSKGAHSVAVEAVAGELFDDVGGVGGPCGGASMRRDSMWPAVYAHDDYPVVELVRKVPCRSWGVDGPGSRTVSTGQPRRRGSTRRLSDGKSRWQASGAS